MKKKFQDVLEDIQEKLIGKTLHGISGVSSSFVVTEVDNQNEYVVLDVQGKRKTWSFERMNRVWKELYYRPAANVEVVFGGSGSSRNQVETIYANLGYVEWLYVKGKKCVAYVGEDCHPYGELKHMDKEKETHYGELMKASNPRNPLLEPDENPDDDSTDDNEINPHTGYQSAFERNRILFGAPGTGKSFTVNKEAKELIGADNERDYERVTFHPDYSYANFVGTYKPVPCKDSDGKDAITYAYVPGPFMRVYVKALKNSREKEIKPFLLIIEEINRANVSAVFGDIFQLLDRGNDGVSEYPIQASEDIKKYLVDELGGQLEDYKKIRIPDNMFIWATMNSADQGVFPMDTAFKRRWDFTYLGINDSDEDIRGKYVYLADDRSQKVEWNKLRKAINNFLAKEKINEDKQLGPYFISRSIVVPEIGDEIDRDKFISVFKNKVIMYLFEDAARQKQSKLFEGCFSNASRYSEICWEFEAKGIGIFCSDIQIETEPEEPSINFAETE
jgi:hypothetical protein